MMVANSKSTRNADYRHAQSIGRQRQAAQRAAADVSPQGLADILPQNAAPLLPDVAPVTTSSMLRPSWRDREPAIVHSIKWRDSDNHEHLHIVRGDTLDEVLLHLRMIKAVIAAARAREGTGDALATGDVVPTCPDHHVPMRKSQYKGFYCTHKTADGVYCTRKVKGK
jgi:hypothetical protein